MDYKGLGSEEVEELRAKFGYNEIPKGEELTALKIFLRQFEGVTIYLLLAVLGISIFLNETAEVIVVSVIICIVLFLGFINEYRASKEMKSLRKLIVPECIVIRNGNKEVIPTKEVVPGDIVYLSTGDIVPADGFIFDSLDLRINESILTGESEAALKEPTKNADKYINSKELPVEILDELSEENKAYMSTSVVEGNGYLKVTHIGKNTEFAKIAQMVKEQEAKSIDLTERPLKFLTLVSIIFAIATFFVFVFRNTSFPNPFINFFNSGLLIEGLTITLAMLVSGLPEGLPVVKSIALSLGVREMSKRNALVNRLNAIQAIGKTSFICVDKTGTLTKNELTAQTFFFNNKKYDVSGTGYNNKGEIRNKNRKVDYKEVELFVDSLILCNEAELKIKTQKQNETEYEVLGSTTEGSLLVLGEKLGITKAELDSRYPKIEEIPFSSSRKYMATLHKFPFSSVLHSGSALSNEISKDNLENTLFVKGAPEILLKKSDRIIEKSHIEKLTKKRQEEIEEEIEKLSSQGYRILGAAVKTLKKGEKLDESSVEGLIFLGFVVLRDAPREEVPEAIRSAKNAGIKIMMITGDHKNTGEAIAKDVGLISEEDKDKIILTGPELDSLTDEELESIVEQIVICARARPEHKLRIISALKKKNHIVAMTGDGVNDAPALKKADIGIAVGSGTEVAKEVSDIILNDDSFSTIVSAIHEGRRFLENLQKFGSYQFSANIAEISIIFLSILLGVPSALTALQILFMNLVTDDLPAIALSANKASKDVLRWKVKKEEGLFTKPLTLLTITSSAIMTFFVFFTYLISLNRTSILELSRGSAMFLLILFELLFAVSFRSFRKPFFKIRLRENKFLLITIIISFIATIFVFLEPLNDVFDVAMIPLSWMLWLFVISFFGLAIFDFLKLRIMKSYYELEERV